MRVEPLYDHDGQIAGAVPYLMCKHLGYEDDTASVKMIRAAEWSTDGDILTMTDYTGRRFVLRPATDREAAKIKAWRKKVGNTSKVDAWLLEEWQIMAAGWAPKMPDEAEEDEDELPETVDP